MKTFEERYNEWLDGSFDAASDPEFQKQLQERGLDLTDMDDWNKTQALLRSHLTAPQLTNEDFFNSEIRRQIALSENNGGRSSRHGTWSLPKIAWLGGALTTAAIALFAILPGFHQHRATPQPLNTTIVSAVADEPGISVAAIQSPEQGYALLWIDGLDYLPAEHRIQ